ncbi:hypothetical protein EF847_07370 [Actinobacteria bacterium YIM 96077]|uniref:TraD/TraG TraM recognition site domain-containing protein n=1 Tax=Phytoactinopolyspora halophila TaxID=1981511 RepID=A0A329QJZ6_9ACTN|nr:hypothetical protein [Phytoactinopolyspora halophila]AYY12550.1 hypothetical protein EF847_07370 [Actinobacteria bacterium YIM 96077]RAW12546.1 hypothetical protein DPM12_14215 [Phytoactinopolyspora halophila]
MAARMPAARSTGARMDPPLLLALDEIGNLAPLPSLPTLMMGFNTRRRHDPDRPDWVEESLRWASRNIRPVTALTDPTVLRGVLDGLAVRLDGTPRAASVVSRWRKILAVNPIPALK